MRYKFRLLCLFILLINFSSCGYNSDRKNWLKDVLIEDSRKFLLREPELVEEKMVKMAENPYYYFRGSLSVFMADQTGSGSNIIPETDFSRTYTLSTMIIGDPHIENIGTWRNDGKITVNFNDFDASTFGPVVSDLRRFALSLFVAGKMMLLEDDEINSLILDFSESWCSVMSGKEIEENSEIIRNLIKESLDEGRDRKELKKYTLTNNGGKRTLLFGDISRQTIHRIYGNEKKLTEDFAKILSKFGDLKSSGRLTGKGVSSLVLKRYLLLMEGASLNEDDDIILDIKELTDAFTFQYLSDYPRTDFSNNGERLEKIQKTLLGLSAGSDFPKSICFDSACFRVQELTYYEQGIDFVENNKPDPVWDLISLADYAVSAGKMMAELHLNGKTVSGKSSEMSELCLNSDALFSEMTYFTNIYGNLTMDDYELFKEIIKEDGPLLGWNKQWNRP